MSNTLSYKTDSELVAEINELSMNDLSMVGGGDGGDPPPSTGGQHENGPH